MLRYEPGSHLQPRPGGINSPQSCSNLFGAKTPRLSAEEKRTAGHLHLRRWQTGCYPERSPGGCRLHCFRPSFYWLPRQYVCVVCPLLQSWHLLFLATLCGSTQTETWLWEIPLSDTKVAPPYDNPVTFKRIPLVSQTVALKFLEAHVVSACSQNAHRRAAPASG